MRMIKIDLVAEVYKARPDVADWVVWASDPAGDGEIYETVFCGPDAQKRACEYAEAKYTSHIKHEPDQRPKRSGLRVVK